MTDRLFALQLFRRVARAGSFSAAARDLGLSQPSTSRIIATLEREVGASLVTRTTHALRLTEVGADYLARVEAILAALEEADHAARGGGDMRGTLRVAASAGLIIREVVPDLSAFADLHPALRLEFVAADHRLNLVSAGIDVALRFGRPEDISAVARRLGQAARVLVASPRYLEHAGPLAEPRDLARHAVLLGPASRRREAWTFRRGPDVVTFDRAERLSFSDDEGATAAARAGLGIISTSLWGCRAEVASGALLPVLPDWDLGVVELHALFAAGRAAKPAAKAFADHLATSLVSRKPAQ